RYATPNTMGESDWAVHWWQSSRKHVHRCFQSPKVDPRRFRPCRIFLGLSEINGTLVSLDRKKLVSRTLRRLFLLPASCSGRIGLLQLFGYGGRAAAGTAGRSETSQNTSRESARS